MPKIIQHGIKKNAAPPWYVGHAMVCHHCGCRWEIEEGDKVTGKQAKSPNGAKSVAMPCPDCGKTVEYSVPGRLGL